MLKKEEFVLKLGTICKVYRQQELNMTLKNMHEQTDIPISTISGFENGKSTNIEIFYFYIAISNKYQLHKLIRLINYVICEVNGV